MDREDFILLKGYGGDVHQAKTNEILGHNTFVHIKGTVL